MSERTETSPKNLVAIGIALLFLLAATFGLAHLELGVFSTPVALLIATAKALLVALYFMNLKYTKGMVRIAAVTGLFWLGVLVGLSMGDYLSRNWLTLPAPWPQKILGTIRRE